MEKITKRIYKDETAEFEPVNDIFEIQKNFESLIPSVMMFIEQEAYSNAAMHLDVNFCRVFQANYKWPKRNLTMEEAIFEKNGKTFENSLIELIFYEKMITSTEQKIGLEEKEKMPKIFLMSKCRLNQEIDIDIEGLTDDLELSFEYEDASAQYVTFDQYQQLLFVMGLYCHVPQGTHQDYKLILSIFKLFHLGTADNFKDMLHQLDFPYEYDEKKTLAENRHHFKSFFHF